MILCWFFKGFCFVLTFYVIVFLIFLLLLWLCPFLKNQIILVWVCLATFWCFMISF